MELKEGGVSNISLEEVLSTILKGRVRGEDKRHGGSLEVGEGQEGEEGGG